jgi:hypothetical protein
VTLWFRMYGDLIHDPKVLMLSDAMFRAWVTLLCLASKNDGVLPAAGEIAVVLREKPAKIAKWLSGLTLAGLIDKCEDGSLVPHNWEGRQFKSDSSKERMQRLRAKQRDVECDVTSTVTVTLPESEQNKTDDVADEQGPKPGKSSVSDEAVLLTEKLMAIAGHDPKFWPPGWCGAPLRVQTWLNQEWPAEVIIAATTAVTRRKKGAPANSVQFFEKAIAEEVARQARPLPSIEIKEKEMFYVQANQHRSESLSDVAKRLAESGLGFGPKPTGFPRSESGATVRMLPEG